MDLIVANLMARMSWPKARQWQWLEDYCHWLDDGCSPLQAARAMQLSAAEYKLRNEQQLAQHLCDCLRSGQPLANALHGWLASSVLQVFVIGQQHHCLNELMHQYRQFERARTQLQLSLWKQRLYPLFILALVLVACTVAGHSYLPRLMAYVENPQPHWSITAMTLLADGVIQLGPWLLVLALLVAIIYQSVARYCLMGWRFALERYGLFTAQRALGSVWVTQMVALLMRQRLSLRQTLIYLQPLASPYINHHLCKMQQQLAMGERRLARVMATGLLTSPLLFRLHNSSQPSAAAEGLWRTAKRCDQTIKQQLLRRQQLLLSVIYVAIVGLLMVLVQAAGSALQQILMMS